MNGDNAAYEQFLASKIVKPSAGGFDIDQSELNPELKDFQKAITQWSLKKGKSAMFCGTGTGKTFMQLEWANHVCRQTGGDILILAPLAVSLQTIAEGQKFGITVNHARTDYQVKEGINIINYEMLEHFDASRFAGVVLDESSILKAYMGKTRNFIIDFFKDTPYKLAGTATPAPNDYTEIGNHSEFLDILNRQEMLAKFFINDTSDTQTWRLKGHAGKHFWEWVSSWAICMEMPSDIGFDNNGFVLPPLNIHEIVVKANIADFDNGKLFKSDRPSAINLHGEMRETSLDRAKVVAEIVNESKDIWLIWCNTNYEADDLKRLIPDAKEVRGSDSIDKKESLSWGFSQGNIRVLISKPSIFGFGMNFQVCHKQVFVGLSYSFEKQYQAIRRCWRYGQVNPVDVYMVMAETETGVYRSVQEKGKKHQKMVEEMMGEIRQADNYFGKQTISMDCQSKVIKGDDWQIINGDCVEETKKLPDNHVDFSIFSPPFAQLFVYSNSIRDMGNCSGDDEFFKHFNFLIPELLRITRI